MKIVLGFLMQMIFFLRKCFALNVSLPHFLGKIRTVQLICQLTTLIVLGAVTRLTEVREYWNTHEKYRNTLDFITTDIYI